jgi:hypothetical protein
VFEEDLLQEEERALVQDSLPHLHVRNPAMWGERLPAVVALHSCYDVLTDKALLQNDSSDVLLYRTSHLQPSTMRLRPDKCSINQLQLVQPLRLVQA